MLLYSEIQVTEALVISNYVELLTSHGHDGPLNMFVFVFVQRSSIAAEERDVYEELLTQQEIQNSVELVNSECTDCLQKTSLVLSLHIFYFM